VSVGFRYEDVNAIGRKVLLPTLRPFAYGQRCEVLGWKEHVRMRHATSRRGRSQARWPTAPLFEAFSTVHVLTASDGAAS
jgi:hypothetical protein